MFSGKVFIPLIWWTLINLCCLSLCASSTVELSVFPNEVVDYGSSSGTVRFMVDYNITESGKVFGIRISMGSAVVVNCVLSGEEQSTIGAALSAKFVPPNNCSSLKYAGFAVDISSGMLDFNVTFFNTTVELGWSAGLLDFAGAVSFPSSTLYITVGDLRKTANVTIDWSPVPEMVFRCSIGEVRPAVNLVLTVPGSGPETVKTPDTVELMIPHNSTLNGGNFSCTSEVVYPVMKNLTDSFPIEYAPVFQSNSVSVTCPNISCQVTLDCNSQDMLAYPAANRTWPELNSTDSAIVVNGTGDYTCQATNYLGYDTVLFRVTEVCDGKVCQHGGTLHLETCKCSCKPGYYGDECQYEYKPVPWPIVAVVVVLGVYIVYIVVSVVAAFTCVPDAGEWFLAKGVVCKLGAVAGGIVVIYWICPEGRCCLRPSTNDPDPPMPLKGTADGRMKPEVGARGGGGTATYVDVDLPITAPRSLPPLRTAPRRGPEKPPRSNADPRHTSEEVPSSNDLYTEVVRKVDRRAPGPGNRRGQGEEARMVENTIYGSN